MKYWTPETKRQRREMFRSMDVCTRCQRGSATRFALCLDCRTKTAAQARERYHRQASKKQEATQ